VRIFVDDVAELRFDDGTPVSAASGIAPLGDGWLVVQDDATHAAWWRAGSVTAVRMLPPVDGLDRFSEAAGTKHLKPDLEGACPVEAGGAPGVLALGSGSSPRRTRAVLVRPADGRPVVESADLAPLYARIAEVLDVPTGQLNLEGAGRDAGRVRWFQRGNLAAGVPNASVTVPLDELVGAVLGDTGGAQVHLDDPQIHDLGEVDGVGLAVTDAVVLPDGRTLVSAAAEDTPNAVDDGPVVATALALLDGDRVLAVARLPEVNGAVRKVEGLAVRDVRGGEVHLLAVVDVDDPTRPSAVLRLRAVPG
jgi:hypothetical protein